MTALGAAAQGPAPGFDCRVQLSWQSEARRQKSVASNDHVKNWPLLEKILADKNYSVLLTHTV
jgi:hypothetical protein